MTLPSRPAEQSLAVSAADPRAGILWMLLTVALFVSLDALAKYLTQYYPTLQVTWARFFFHAMWLIPVLRWRFFSIMRTRHITLQLSRGFLMFIANALFFAGVSLMPLVSASTIVMLSPLIVTALSVPLLGEQVGPRRWACVIAACIGALIVIRPGAGVLHWAALLPLGSALSYGLYQIATRHVGQVDPPMTTLFYSVSVGVPLTTLIMPFIWVAPDLKAWLLMAGLGLIGGVSHFTLIKAFAAAPVAVVAPFNYTNLIWATLFGFLLFQELPDRWTILGALIIATSGLYAFLREQKRRAEDT